MLLLLSLFAASTVATPLTPRVFTPLPVGSVTPKGWLLKQLTLQAEGLSGHLAQFWNDVMNSIWIGGAGDGGLHERTPYWLNGVVPLAFLLKNANVKLDPVVGIYKAPWGPAPYHGCLSGDGCKTVPTPQPVDMMAQVDKYISYILAHQAADGWLGPAFGNGDDYWGPSNILQSLWQYAEAKQLAGDTAAFTNASQAVLRHLLRQYTHMQAAPLTSWAQARWIDMMHSAEWLLDHADVSAAQAVTLGELIALLKAQGEDWDGWFEAIPATTNHNVNVAQGLKSAAVWARYNASATSGGFGMAELSLRRMQKLDAAYGFPTGMYAGDEITPDPATRSPSRGIELCGVVEAMYSYELMYATHGTLAFADRCERVAYNALPATWASPTGGDMWAHQYLQAVNEINAIKADPHVWQHDGDMAETYGLEPNYGCCTANFHQGWPKLANALFHTRSTDGGVVVSMYAPASAALPNGGTVAIDTTYPFGDVATVTVDGAPAGTPVYLRVPGWATAATVNGVAVKNGTLFKAGTTTMAAAETTAAGGAASGANTWTIAFKPEVRLEEWDRGAVSVHRGALLYSLPIGANYTVYAHHFGTDQMSNDYYVNPTTPWRFALDVDPSVAPPATTALAFESVGYADGAAPFNHSNWPTRMSARLRAVLPEAWGVVDNSAAVPPQSPACPESASASASGAASPLACGAAEYRDLVPHGGTELRIGEWPVASFPKPQQRQPQDLVEQAAA